MPYEPMTVVTDFILSAVALLISWRFYRLPFRFSQKYWISVSFLLVGISAFLAGIWHGYHPVLSWEASVNLWTTSMCFLFLFSFGFLIGTYFIAFKTVKERAFLLSLFSLKFLLFFFMYSKSTATFSIPFYDYCLSLILILILIGTLYFKSKKSFFLWILAGLLLIFFSALLWIFRIPSLTYFNHNDLFHVLQTVSVFFLYRGYKIWLIDTFENLKDNE